jgi:hypothetical protein
VHPSYLQAPVAAGPKDTVLITTFSVLCPDAPHRVLRSCADAALYFDLVAPTQRPNAKAALDLLASHAIVGYHGARAMLNSGPLIVE